MPVPSCYAKKNQNQQSSSGCEIIARTRTHNESKASKLALLQPTTTCYPHVHSALHGWINSTPVPSCYAKKISNPPRVTKSLKGLARTTNQRRQNQRCYNPNVHNASYGSIRYNEMKRSTIHFRLVLWKHHSPQDEEKSEPGAHTCRSLNLLCSPAEQTTQVSNEEHYMHCLMQEG